MWISPWFVSAGRVTVATPSAGLIGTATEYTLVVPYTVEPQPPMPTRSARTGPDRD